MTVATIADLGVTPEAWAMLDPESRRLIDAGCIGKVMLGKSAARQTADHFSDAVVRPYRCPFTLDGNHHWHVGNVPTMDTVAAIARTIRDLHGVRPTGVEQKPKKPVRSSEPRRKKETHRAR